MINCLVKTLSLIADKSGHYNKNREKIQESLLFYNHDGGISIWQKSAGNLSVTYSTFTLTC